MAANSGSPLTRRRSAALSLATAFALLGSLGLSTVPSAAAPPGDPAPATPGTVATGKPVTAATAKSPDAVADRPARRQSVFVQLAGRGAADAAASARPDGKAAARTAARSRRAEVSQAADAVVDTAQASDTRARELFAVANAVPGVAVKTTPDAIEAIEARTDVVSVRPLVPKTVTNNSAAQLTKVLNTWQDLGVTGEGVRIGVIDTGIDYTHADFGGPGTVAAWEEAHANPAAPFVPTPKVVGGHDFVGDDYNADPTDPGFQPVPHPDDNPLDCNEHGTHVAGTAAGYGVNDDGSTFNGDYSTLQAADLDKMKIGPGMAPEASLYALKVFGCTGSTEVLIPALDWALDPNGDGSFGDHLDVVNLSLGTDYGTVDDPEGDVVNELAAHGVLPVLSIGNNGDLTDTGGSPGNAVRSLAVASSIDAAQLRDGLRVNAPADVAGIASGQVSVAFDWANEPPVTGDVVAIPGANADGCDPLSAAEAAAVAGEVAWLEWDDNDATRRCGSVGRSDNVTAAGAIGAIFTSSLNVFDAGITGSDVIPVFQLPKVETDRLRPALDAGTLNVTFDGSLVATVKDRTESIEDMISSFTSRGPHGSIGVVKPDVAAPGDTIASARMGSGSDVLVISGTSMASPHTAGIGALVRAQHPDWSPEQVKAAIMNTAGHDLFDQENRTGNRYGPARVGAGRVDALAAVTTEVLAYAADTPGAVSASFGVVPAPADKTSVTRTRRLTVENTGSATKTVSLAYDPVVTQPGVSYTVSPSRLTVRAGKSATAEVTMTVRTGDLRKTLDPTMAATQTNPFFGDEEARQYLSDASGRVLVTPGGASALRVPVYGAAKPASVTKARDGKVGGDPAIILHGSGVNQGTGSEAYTSLVSVLDLGAKSPRLPRCTIAVTTGCTFNTSSVAADLRYVGAGSVPEAGVMWFGLETYGDWATIGNGVTAYVDFDTTGDGDPDYEVFVQNIEATDLLEAFLVDLNSGELLSIIPVNFGAGDTDTNVFDSNVLLLPVDLSAIGVDPADAPLTYVVGMWDNFAGADLDQSRPASFNAGDPAVSTSSPLFLDQGNVAIDYTLGSTAGRNPEALVLHLHGQSGERAEVVKLKGSKR
jgi:subtilisin family serine protease